MRFKHLVVVPLLALSLCATAQQGGATMDDLAEQYVKLVLAVGVHDADYVDAYYGPPEWRTAAEAARRDLAELRSDALALESALAGRMPPRDADELVRLRHAYLSRQTAAMVARIEMLRGDTYLFDVESKALYDAVAPVHTEEEFQTVLRQLD